MIIYIKKFDMIFYLIAALFIWQLNKKYTKNYNVCLNGWFWVKHWVLFWAKYDSWETKGTLLYSNMKEFPST